MKFTSTYIIFVGNYKIGIWLCFYTKAIWFLKYLENNWLKVSF